MSARPSTRSPSRICSGAANPGVPATALSLVAERCTEVETGARNVDHILSGTLLPRISTEILRQMSVGPLPDQLEIGIDEEGQFSYTFPQT